MENEPGAAPEVPARGRPGGRGSRGPRASALGSPAQSPTLFPEGTGRPQGSPLVCEKCGCPALLNNANPTFHIPAHRPGVLDSGSLGCGLATLRCLCGALGCGALGSPSSHSQESVPPDHRGLGYPLHPKGQENGSPRGRSTCPESQHPEEAFSICPWVLGFESQRKPDSLFVLNKSRSTSSSSSLEDWFPHADSSAFLLLFKHCGEFGSRKMSKCKAGKA